MKMRMIAAVVALALCAGCMTACSEDVNADPSEVTASAETGILTAEQTTTTTSETPTTTTTTTM